MRVLHIVGDSKWGGGGAIILGLIDMARDMGWQAGVLATDPVCRARFAERGVNVIPLDVIWRDVRPARDLAGLYRLTTFLRRNHFDLVHTHTSKAGFVGRIAARLAGVPMVVHTAHSFSFHEESGTLASIACRSLETFAALFCDRLITVSNYHRDWGRRLRIAPPDKLLAIPNGIPETPRSAVSEASLKASLGLQPKEFLIFTPGRLFPGKGLEYLIDAVPLLTQAIGAPFRIALAGDGILRRELELQASRLGILDRILFLGFRKDIGDLLAASDLVVLPSLHEGMSIALLEAMAAGKAIVATNIGGNAEATCQGDGAVLVPPKHPVALANAIRELAGDPAQRHAFGARARRLFEHNHTEATMLSGYRRAYLALAGSSQRVYAGKAGPTIWHPKE